MPAARKQTTRKPPHDREAEEAVLASVLIEPTVMVDVFDVLQADDFFITRHKWLYQAYVELFVNDIAIDFVTVSDFLERQPAERGSNAANRLDDIGGPGWLTSIISQPVRSYNALDYANIVNDYAVRREHIEKATRIAQLAYNESMPIEDVEAEIDKLTVTRPNSGTVSYVTARQAGEDLIDRINSGAPQGAQTSLPNENLVYGGYPLQALTLIIGDSSIGKTAKMFQDCEYLSANGERVLFFSFEHSPERLIARKIFASQGISMIKMRQGKLNAGEKAALEQATRDWYAAHKDFVIDNRSRTIPEMVRVIRQVRPLLIVVDDATHVYVEGKERMTETAALLTAITRMHDMANDHDAAMVAIHHITAEEAQKLWPGGQTPKSNMPPSLNALTWAKDIRYKVDVWLALVPDFQTKVMNDHIKIIEWVMKDREGQRLANPIELYFHKEKQAFFDNTNPTGRLVMQMPTHAPTPVPQGGVYGQTP